MTTQPTKARRALTRAWWSIVVGATAAGAMLLAEPPEATAAPGVGCQEVLWGFFASQRRTICDGPLLSDGSWMRTRTIWSPRRWVPLRCNLYSGYCSGGYWQEPSGTQEVYPVRPETVLPDEPGHLLPV
ncbi:hypothetical protein [Mycobacterium phage Weirdo19]|uniref:CDGP domain-containing protein n=1 Tax=Mycobacterium phage Weirdo19 TaxID=2601610 RepID=A0A6M2YSU0_9CAUD|nr:hypothetical protein KDJ11_gp38 [Mycobacterium phage Weirdo19]QEA10806.1 hypothetical protein [Mycobacterium phage Weirdo19]